MENSLLFNFGKIYPKPCAIVHCPIGISSNASENVDISCHFIITPGPYWIYLVV